MAVEKPHVVNLERSADARSKKKGAAFGLNDGRDFITDVAYSAVGLENPTHIQKID